MTKMRIEADNHDYCRDNLNEVLAVVYTRLGPEEVKEAWVHKTTIVKGNAFEFHFRDFYWNGRADCSFDAKAQGWQAWLDQQEDNDPAQV